MAIGNDMKERVVSFEGGIFWPFAPGFSFIASKRKINMELRCRFRYNNVV